MATRGRKPSVAARKNPVSKRRPVLAATAGGEVVDITPPKGTPARVVRVWKAVVPSLTDRGILIAADLPLVMDYCRAKALADQFYERLMKCRDIDSSIAKRLRVGFEKNTILSLRIAGELGLGPVSRVRLGLMKVKGTSLVEGLKSKGRTASEVTKRARQTR